MKSNKSNDNLLRNTFAWEEKFLQKGQRIVYEGDIAYVIRVKPFLVIKSKKGVVCGALHQQIR
ncbi:MAG: hypothetical protein V3V90_05775 [Thermodesulfobacteriota bacterium]